MRVKPCGLILRISSWKSVRTDLMNKKKKNIHRVDVDKLNCTLYIKKNEPENCFNWKEQNMMNDFITKIK